MMEVDLKEVAAGQAGDFDPEQKRYLEGFVAGVQIAKAAKSVAGATVSPAAAAPPERNPAEQAAPADQARPGEVAKPERHRRRTHEDHGRRHGDEQRSDRPRRERERPPAHASRHERRQDRNQERREKAPDPNSPFAKLAALKAQLEAEAKERR